MWRCSEDWLSALALTSEITSVDHLLEHQGGVRVTREVSGYNPSTRTGMVSLDVVFDECEDNSV